MPTTTNKQRLLNQIFAHLPRAGKGGQDGSCRAGQNLSVLEQFVYAVCREGSPPVKGPKSSELPTYPVARKFKSGRPDSNWGPPAPKVWVLI